MFFSIIIPTYNSRNKIVATLNSIKKQSYKNYEVLIIDDNSNDNTVGVIKKVIDKIPNFRLYCLKKNSGPHFAISYGIKKAKGEYFVLGSHDDIFLRERLEILNSHLVYRKHLFIISEDLKYTKKSIHKGYAYHHKSLLRYTKISLLPIIFLRSTFFSFANIAIHSSLKKYFLNCNGFGIAGDFAFVLNVLFNCKCKFLFIPRPLILRFYGNDTLSRKMTNTLTIDSKKVIDHFLNNSFISKVAKMSVEVVSLSRSGSFLKFISTFLRYPHIFLMGLLVNIFRVFIQYFLSKKVKVNYKNYEI